MRFNRALCLEDSELAAELICRASCRLIVATCDDETSARFDREWEKLFGLLHLSISSIETGIHALELTWQNQ